MFLAFLDDLAEMFLFIATMLLQTITQLLLLFASPIDKLAFHCFDTALLLLLALYLFVYLLLLFCIVHSFTLHEFLEVLLERTFLELVYQ